MDKKWGAASKRFFSATTKSIWLFPSILIFVMLGLTAFRISGSSISAYPMNYGVGASDPNRIFGFPRGVRSDEWLVITQMTVAQSSNDFKKINNNIGNGQDMSLVGDAPYKEWSAVFKPQNLVFFVLPLEYAFAFKWWLLGILLVLSCYFLMLELFPKKILRAVLVSLLLGLSPFVAWWYQSITLLPLAYSFLMILVILRLLKSKTNRQKLIYSLVLAYILVCFGLVLYPPFQIPCFIAVLTFMVGWGLENYNTRQKFKVVVGLWPYAALTAVIVIAVGAAFYFSRREAILTTTHTVYPGQRVELGGGANPLLFSSSFLSPNLQHDSRIPGYFSNQSEDSNFIFIAPFLFLPSIYLIYLVKKQKKKLLWGLVLINGLMVVFLMKMYVESSVLEHLYKLLLLEKVPNNRLLIGLGLAGLLQLVLIMKTYDELNLKRSLLHKLGLLGGLAGLASMLYVGYLTAHRYPLYISNHFKIAVLAAWVAAGVYFILIRRFNLGLGLLVAFSLLSVGKVMPLYRGLAPLTTNEPAATIKSYPDKGGWVVLDDRLLINFPLMAGKHAVNSVDFYPQLKLWHQIDKNNEYVNDYNRFAHVVFIDDPKMTDPFVLKYTDTLYVKFEPCKDFLQAEAKYVLSDKILDEPCVRLDKKVHMEQKDMYIYQITTPVVKNT